MNYCDLNEYEDYIENIEFFLKEKCLQICIINSELKNRKKIYIKDIEEIYWEKYFFDQQENRKIKSMCDEISYSLVASESKLILYTLEIDNNKNLIQIEIGDDFYLKIKAKEVDIIQAINNSKKSFNKKRNNNKFNYDVWNGMVPEVAEPTMAAAAHAVACQLYGAHDPARVVHRTLASTVTGRAQPDEAFQFSMELLERRYRDENALLAAVSRGDYDAAVRHLGRFSIKNFTPRTGELLRDVKNMLIVVNTLLRKAAESGGVHPVYIDQLSGALAVKIERVADTMEANRLGLEMLRRYCRLVRNDAHSGCSQAVQKTLSYISLHLSGELSLRSIAAALGFNATYLSAQFSRERGETLTAYIHTLRLQTARRLLDETDLPVAEVAARVGMVDVAYFSRLFKKKYGLSPLRYRARPAEG